jgi:hypothetical protein
MESNIEKFKKSSIRSAEKAANIASRADGDSKELLKAISLFSSGLIWAQGAVWDDNEDNAEFDDKIFDILTDFHSTVIDFVKRHK